MNDPRNMEPEEALDALLDDAKAGVSDQWLADRADVSIQQVRLWKKTRGLRSDKKETHETLAALSGLLVDYVPGRHQVADSVDFKPPKYVLRQPLDYTQFCRTAFMLLESLMFTARQISQALGVSIADVELAVAMYRRHLTRRGIPCLGCPTLVDPRFSKWCSRSCHDRTISK